MGFFTKKIKKEIVEVLIKEKVYKVTIYYEKRKNSRVSITKTGINVRIPSFLPKKEQKAQVDKFINWAKKTIAEKNISFSKNKKIFKDGDSLKLYDQILKIHLSTTKLKSVKAKIKAENIIISIPEEIKNAEKNDIVSKLLTKLISKAYKEKIIFKLHEFNDIHKFGILKNVRLKNNSTNWGSCSSKNNINISIRLLLAPEWVVDYVLIHELSHLKHRNHSVNFWNEVENAFPEFKKAEKWLKTNAVSCII